MSETHKQTKELGQGTLTHAEIEALTAPELDSWSFTRTLHTYLPTLEVAAPAIAQFKQDCLDFEPLAQIVIATKDSCEDFFSQMFEALREMPPDHPDRDRNPKALDFYEKHQEASWQLHQDFVQWLKQRMPPAFVAKLALPEFEPAALTSAPLALEKRRPLPKRLAQPTFSEAHRMVYAISDGRDGRDWEAVEGAFALLHRPTKTNHQVKFEPNNLLVTWWGKPTLEISTLWDELARLEFDAIVTFNVALAAILDDPKARWTVSIDDIIRLIGRDTDARRSATSRQEWRHKVWRWMLFFDSLAVIGARPGTWREPAPKSQKGDKMPPEKLISRDPLFRIIGTSVTGQGTFDNSEPPKQVSIVPGEWLMQFHNDRRFLSDFGDVLSIAGIARGKPSGAWAACAGFMLQQLWREEASHAKRSRTSKGQEAKSENLTFRAFTRRELLSQTMRSDHDVNTILSDSKSRHRARDYWKEAIKELKKRNVIGHYSGG